MLLLLLLLPLLLAVSVVVFRRRYIVAAVLVALLHQQGCLFVCCCFEARCLFVDFLVLHSLYEHMLTVTGSPDSMWCSFACVIVDPLFHPEASTLRQHYSIFESTNLPQFLGYIHTGPIPRAQELCESRGGRP